MHVCLCLFWVHGSFLLGSGVHSVLFVPPKSLFPQSCESSVTISHWPSKSDSLGFLSPSAGCPGWEICCGSRTSVTVRELLWSNCSPVCGLSVGGSVLGLMCLPGLLKPEAPSPWQAPAGPCLLRRYSNTPRECDSVSCGILGSW